MSIHDFNRIDEAYHSMYRNRFHREEPFETVSEEVSEDEEYNAKAKAHAPEAAKTIMHKLKLEYGDKFNHEKARAAVKHALGSATEEDCEGWMQDKSHTPEQKKEMYKYVNSPEGEAAEERHCSAAAGGCLCGGCDECTPQEDAQELGVDPKEAAEYDQARKDISYDNYPFWDAYHAVKEGAWTEDDFHQWCQTVWNDGANEGNRPH